MLSYYSRVLPGATAQHLLKLDNTGQTVHENRISQADTSFRIFNIFDYHDTAIVATGGTRALNGGNDCIWVMSADSSLGIKWSHFFELPVTNFICSESSIDSKNYIVTANTSDFYVFLNRFSITGDSIDGISFYPTSAGIAWDIMEDTAHSRYIVPGMYSTLSISPAEFMFVNNDLSGVSYDSIPFLVSYLPRIKQANDTTFYLAGNKYDYETDYQDIGVMKLDKNLLCQKFQTMGKPGDTIDYSAFEQCLDFKYPSHLYVGGTSNFDKSVNNNLSDSKSWFILSRFDSALNIVWTKFYGGDAYYTMDGLTATSDKGCLIWGGRYDYLTQSGEQDVQLLKVGEDGLFTGLPSPGLQVHDAIVYPNPGTDSFVLRTGPQVRGCTFAMADMHGHQVCSLVVGAMQQTIPAQGLAPGSYAWSISRGGKTLDSGVWIKR